MATSDKLIFTDEQRSAIRLRGASVALSAGAGCGKTFVLTERFLSHLAPECDAGPAQLGELIAFTYTDRAAREMRDRIRRKCHERLQAADPSQAGYWLGVLRQLDSARVSTIHSFCASLLRAHAVEAGLDPAFDILEPAQSETLRFQLTADELRRRLEARQPQIIELARLFGLGGVEHRVAALLASRSHYQSDPFRSWTVEQLVAHWKPLAAELSSTILTELVQCRAAAQAVRFVSDELPRTGELGRLGGALVEQLTRLADSPAVEQLATLRDLTMFNAWPKRLWSDASQLDRFKPILTSLRKEIDAVDKHLRVDWAAAHEAARLGLALLDISLAVAETFGREKRRKGMLDFEDLLVEAHRLLADPRHAALRRSLSRSIVLLLLDESQDTDPIQTDIIRHLCDGRTDDGKLFVVGDFKQSIYRFRGADPREFQKLRSWTRAEGRLPLTLNFRSQPAILSFVNALFCDEFGDQYEMLVPHRRQVTREPAIELLWSPPPASRAAGAAAASRRIEAEWIARRLVELIEGAEPLVYDPQQAATGGVENGPEGGGSTPGKPADHSSARAPARGSGAKQTGKQSNASSQAHFADKSTAGLRPLRPGDIVILLRALSDVEYYEEALRAHGLPYYLVGGKAFYSQQEVFDIANLLRAVVSACDELSLAGALRSPLFGLTDETLFWLSQSPGGLAAALDALAALDTLDEVDPLRGGDAQTSCGGNAPEALASVDAPQRAAALHAARTLARLRRLKDRVPIAELIRQAVAMTGYDAALLAEFLGERKLANLQKLIDKARSFDRAGLLGLSDFVVQLSEFVADQPDEALAATLAESSDVVRLMSIHQAKGLEFPVVVVADVSRQLNARGTSAEFDGTWGPLVSLPDGHPQHKHVTPIKLHRLAQRREDDAESTRLFYVATTRAADLLILSGAMNPDEPRGLWGELLARRFDLRTGQTVASLPPGVELPRIAVTLQMPAPHRKSDAPRQRADIAGAIERLRQAAARDGELPPAVAAIPAHVAARRFYSFSRLSGALAPYQPDPSDERETRAPATAWEVDRAMMDGSAGEHALALGKLVHAVLSDVPLNDAAALADADWPALVARHAERHAIAADESLSAEAIDLVRRFLDSPTAHRLRRARQFHPELEFLLAWGGGSNGRPSSRTAAPPPGAPHAGPILHGFIDLLYEDDQGRWHLVDYKTDRIRPADAPPRAPRYEMQMLLYALAAEQVLRQPPASLTLHFLRPGVEVAFNWGDAERARLTDLLEHVLRGG